jgi:hypothetical protein
MSAQTSKDDLAKGLEWTEKFRQEPPLRRMPYQQWMIAMADEISRLDELKSAFAHDAAMYGAQLEGLKRSAAQRENGHPQGCGCNDCYCADVMAARATPETTARCPECAMPVPYHIATCGRRKLDAVKTSESPL